MAVQSKERLNELLEKYRLTGDMNVRSWPREGSKQPTKGTHFYP